MVGDVFSGFCHGNSPPNPSGFGIIVESVLDCFGLCFHYLEDEPLTQS